MDPLTKPKQDSAERDSGTTWIATTGQAWKLYVALASFVVSLLLFVLAAFTLGASMDRAGALTVCGLFLAVTTFGWLGTVLRCPHCSAKLVWTMVATRPHSSWFIDLAGLESCPQCGTELRHPKRARP